MGDGGDGGDGGNGRWEMGDGSWGMEWMQTGRRGAGGDEDGLRYGGMLFAQVSSLALSRSWCARGVQQVCNAVRTRREQGCSRSHSVFSVFSPFFLLWFFHLSIGSLFSHSFSFSFLSFFCLFILLCPFSLSFFFLSFPVFCFFRSLSSCLASELPLFLTP
jgi:hypothetical protein